MRLVVGLGNPGKQYEKTRHNMGFEAIDSIANSFNVKVDKNKYNGLYTEINYYGEKVILLKPQSYINLSGEVISSFLHYYKISVSDLLVISDDLDLEVGNIKLKYKGSAGGHNGLKNIEEHLHTKEYKRLKIGISNNKFCDTKDYVLSKLSSLEREKIDKIMKKMPFIFEDYMTVSFDNVMNKYNKK